LRIRNWSGERWTKDEEAISGLAIAAVSGLVLRKPDTQRVRHGPGTVQRQDVRIRQLHASLITILNCAVDLEPQNAANALPSPIFLPTEAASELERLDEVISGSVAAEPANDWCSITGKYKEAAQLAGERKLPNPLLR
jgi:hypothetical protein